MLNDFPLIMVDESTDARTTEALREAGCKIFSIQEMMAGTTDVDIIQLAAEKGAYILTEDKDFGDELVFKKMPHAGAMLLRLAGVNIEDKIRLVVTAIEKHSEELLNAFSVLNKNKLRIRKNN